ncbi:uncharacterized protein TNIN_46481 [Trichonephila inaurata madagascariensis]|uniref:Uncharacterized protein n=1 Tax=Trichonephila inaurata madagascariensis TaxID=2747483 RepID=A0A8X6YWQ9_9ARAC|nr:uncharacterized protein TNIN_46481 [Trichonephila inaurata madagascariensis]
MLHFNKERQADDSDQSDSNENKRRGIESENQGVHIPDLQSSMDSLERKGFWTLKCSDQDVDSSGLTEKDNVWKVLNDLYEETPEMFQFPPSQWNPSKNGYAMIQCHTPIDSDENFILKIANIIREKIDFPYPLYYFSNDNMEEYVTTYLHTPNGEFYKKEDKAWIYVC